jgi:hypothetical protein
VADATNELRRDTWFNPLLYPGTRRSNEVIGVPLIAVKEHGRERAMTGRGVDALFRVMIPLLANLICHYLSGDPGQGVAVPLAKRELGKKTNRYEPLSFPRSFPKMLKAVTDLGYAQVIKGRYSGLPGQSKRTTVRAAPKLVQLIREHGLTLEDFKGHDDQEVIILKRPKRGYEDEGERIDYEDTSTTNRFRAELQSINARLRKADIQFIPTAHTKRVNVSARQLRRQFTLGKFDRGGRLFGGFWENLPKPVRLLGLRIESERVVGLDYSHLNPVLAYYLADGEPPPGDAYALPGLEEHREGVKKVFNAMLFKHPVDQLPRGARKLFPRRTTCADVTGAILQRHPKLKPLLSNPEIGHRLQFLEGEIMMRVLRQCQERSIIALPVFDCVVVKASAEEGVRRIMVQQFKAVTNLDIAVKRE